MSRIGKNSSVINIDGSGVILQGNVEITGFIAIASADSPACIIEDINGDIIFELSDAVTNKRWYPYTPADTIKTKRINVTTWTNMKRVIIHTKSN